MTFFYKGILNFRNAEIGENDYCVVFYGHTVAILFCILYIRVSPVRSSHTSTHCEAPVHLSDRRYERRLESGLRQGARSMQRCLYALLSLTIALLGVLLVALPRFFLPPPVPVGLLAQNIHRLIFFSF